MVYGPLLLAATLGSSETTTTLRVDVSGGVISRTTPRYASYNVDSSADRGFFHIDFNNSNLRAAAASLEPATLRFGGSGNDYLHYDVPDAGYACASSPHNDSDFYGCLNASHWRDLSGLAQAAGSHFLFGLSFDLAAACAATPNGSYVWGGEEAEAMMAAWLVAGGKGEGEGEGEGEAATPTPVWGFELGNELNNRGPGKRPAASVAECPHQLRPAQQAAAFHRLAEIVARRFPDDPPHRDDDGHAPNPQQRPVLVGPDSGYLNPQPWLNGTLGPGADGAPGAGPLLHAVTHHVYPGVDRAHYNDPAVLDTVLEDIGWYARSLRHSLLTCAFCLVLRRTYLLKSLLTYLLTHNSLLYLL